ncbi:ShlB/FhaC/HecB family hemolysin secretion/activation protein [Parasphingopyxis marina]|uniref:ShlB/FhaC/HecB family hemolysin secretion/activation protein n=1 Tax=Parasphingopyxis marina TaxID=2761622 RepID=A0A842HZ97_9SPHN|nr:ShlB/FhaC/HecB family hemolysin secretion/activation protein [Parasphingopyxis marina]MBC2777837.1 ShlB/FhaC/HecB family hemolysin secretion/activation protein [Parasphingopyxis marina]
MLCPPVAAQNALDRADPAIATESLDMQSPFERPDDVALPPTSIPVDIRDMDADDGVFVGAVRVENTVLPAASFVPAYQGFVGRTLSAEDLRTLTTAVAAVLQNEGYVFATAWIERQRIQSGILQISVDPGVVGQIRYVGDRNSAAEAFIDALSDGEPVTRARLERQLLLAADIPGVRIANPQFFRQEGEGVLQVAIVEDAVAGWAQLDNNGSESVGPWRVQGGVHLRNIVGGGDQLSLSAVATPFEPGDLGFASARYEAGIGQTGTRFALGGFFARSNPDIRSFRGDIEGDSLSAYLTISHPLVRTSEASLWGYANLRYRETTQDAETLRIREDRVTTAELGLNGYAWIAGSHLSGGVQLTQGIAIFDATRGNDPLSSRFDGSGVFTKVQLFARVYRPLGSGFSVEATGQAQMASRPLLAADEMGIGGPAYGRGFDFYERSGENGIAGAMELRYDIENTSDSLDGLQIYGFVDGAGVRNRGAGLGGGRLVSAGAGARATIADRFRLAVEAAAPLNEDRFDSGDRSPRVRLVLGADF